MTLRELLDRKAVFTQEEAAAALGAKDKARHRTKHALLRYYLQAGRLVRARRGLYVVVPPGAAPEMCLADPFLLAAKAAPDAILAYHTAIEFHGKAHSVFRRFFYLSRQQQRPWTFREWDFQRVAPSRALVRDGQPDHEVHVSERLGDDVRVTSLERTLVDLLDRPDLGGGYEEVWRSLESVEFYDLERVVAHALLLRNATTTAKVGFFLEQHQEQLMVEDRFLQPLREHRPKQPHYLERGAKQSTRLLSGWNLVVPKRIFDRSWDEPL